jgi:hypothetical protein
VSNASLFADLNVHRVTLEAQDNNKLDTTTRIWSLGFTVGI